MKALERLHRNYRAAFLRYLPSRDEAALHAGYQIGRSAVTDGTDAFSISRKCTTTSSAKSSAPAAAEELDGVIAAAADFLVEVLATYEMTRRGYLAKP